MPDLLACRHINPAGRPDVSATPRVAGSFRHVFDLVRAPSEQEVNGTASRRLRCGDDFLAAAEFMVTAGFHEKAGATTEVWWLRPGCARRLAYALRPLISAGWDWQSLASEMLTWGVPARLRDVAAYVRYELTRRHQFGQTPHFTAPAVPDVAVDEDDARHRAMLRRREEIHRPAWERYADRLRPQLRQQLADGRRERQDQQQQVAYRPMWREPEEVFLASLPDQSWDGGPTPREIYAARARGQRPARYASTSPAADQGWLDHLRDQAEAERACAVLRAELENWSAGRG